MRTLIRVGAAASLLLAVFGWTATAQLSVGPEVAPASALYFPYYDARTTSGQATVISVTNINTSRMVVPTNNSMTGSVQLHFYFMNCSTTSNTVSTLTPNDTLAQLANVLFTPSSNETGQLLVVAEDPESGNAIDFDYLIGDAIMIDVAGNRTWSYQALGFRALASERGATGSASNAGFLYTDSATNGGDGSSDVDFNGVEYAYFPQSVMVSSFLQNTGTGSTYDNWVALGALYASDVRIEVSGNLYDNDGTATSWTNSFTCWTLWDIHDDISAAAGSVQSDTSEEALGWIRIYANGATDTVTGGTMTNPGIAGVVLQQVAATSFMFGHLLHYSGLSTTGTNWHCPSYPPHNITPAD
jgi:hypothetical protein